MQENPPMDGGETIDKFSILFNPSTPRASPTLAPIVLSAPHSVTSPPHEPPSATDSDFGAFVFVPPSEDPLSMSFSPMATPLTSNFESTGDPHSRISSSSSHEAAVPSHDTSLRSDPLSLGSFGFFEKFTTEAKRASDRNRRVVLDELLLHEDDPLYWLKNEPPSTSDSETESSVEQPQRDEVVESSKSTPKPEIDPFNLADAINDALKETDMNDDRVSRGPLLTSSQSLLSNSRIRSPSLPPPHTLSLPSTEPITNSTPNTPIPPSLSPSPRDSSPRPGPRPSSGSGSYGTLGTLSSRLMSSIISSSRPSAAMTSPNEHKSFDTIFATPMTNDDHEPTLTARGSLPIPKKKSRTALHHAQTFSAGSSSYLGPKAELSISHGTPFASQVYIPPSGAPGFAGDHSWDKGFSDDFQSELLDKRNLVLAGRKPTTVDVLDLDLANLLRPHLPALSRLPRTWNLLYSLDQDGISLKTVYALCERRQVKPGAFGKGSALLVVKDTGDALFGVWIGEGIKLSKGSYYGSGESFLWRFVGGELEVFKWTARNDYVALCELEYLSFGGGDGNYGLYLDDTLLDGSSARCPTFDNKPLCSEGPRKGGAVTFECVGLEVWGIGP